MMQVVPIRFSEHDYKKLKELAKERGESMAETIRKSIKKDFLQNSIRDADRTCKNNDLKYHQSKLTDNEPLYSKVDNGTMRFPVYLTYDIEYEGFVADVPTLPGCMSQGKTVNEAMSNIEDAVRAYLTVLKKHHKTQIPTLSNQIRYVDISTEV